MKTAYLLAGLPGAGKSTVADVGVELTGGGAIRAGEMIRTMAADDGLENPSSKELGEYAAQCREEMGDGFFGEKAVGLLLRDEIDVDYPLFVDSVRHIGGAVEFMNYFDSTYLVWVEADRETRLGRLQGRGRDDEADFTMGDLLERDSHELENLGSQTILDSEKIDYRIQNEAGIDELREEVAAII